jgi:hypothetical protein
MLAHALQTPSVSPKAANTLDIDLFDETFGLNISNDKSLYYRQNEDWVDTIFSQGKLERVDAKYLVLRYLYYNQLTDRYFDRAVRSPEFVSTLKGYTHLKGVEHKPNGIIHQFTQHFASLASPSHFVNSRSAELRSILRQISSLKAGWAGNSSLSPSLEALDALQSLFDVLPKWSRLPDVTVDEDGTIDVLWRRNGRMFSVAVKESGTSIATLSPSSERFKARAYSKNELDRLTRVLSLPFVEELVVD